MGRAALLAALIGAAVAACGSSNNTSSSGASAAAPPVSSSAAKLTGKPLIVADVTDYTLDSTEQQVPPAMEAAANYINSTGGVNGRPIRIVNCNAQGMPAATATCFNQVAQEGALAESGVGVIAGPCCLSILDKAKIPMFQIPAAPQEYANPWVFDFAGYEGTIPQAEAKFAVGMKHAKNVVAVALDLPSTHYETQQFASAATALGANVTRIFYKFGNVDFTPQINQILQLKPDFVVLWGAEPDENRIDAGLKQAGFPLEHVLAGAEAVDQSGFYKPGGSNVVGMYQATFGHNWTDASNPDVAIYRKAMAAAGAEPGSAYGQTAFSNVMMIALAARTLKDPTPVALANYFRTHTNLHIFMGGTENPPTAPLTSILNRDVQIVQWDGSGLKPIATLTG
jgi:ABC-type branched-subunit amino acid transport system substrate-binding protein